MIVQQVKWVEMKCNKCNIINFRSTSFVIQIVVDNSFF